MKPLTLSAHEVRAVLDGTKTQHWVRLKVGDHVPNECVVHDGVAILRNNHTGMRQDVPLAYSPGDQIWVREAWQFWSDGHDCEITYSAGSVYWRTGPNTGSIPDSVLAAYFRLVDRSSAQRNAVLVLTPQHMPRWASRITLDVTGVRVCRVQDVTEADAIATGLIHSFDDGFALSKAGECWGPTAAVSFMKVWNARHGPASWDANDWCAVVDFERIG